MTSNQSTLFDHNRSGSVLIANPSQSSHHLTDDSNNMMNDKITSSSYRGLPSFQLHHHFSGGLHSNQSSPREKTSSTSDSHNNFSSATFGASSNDHSLTTSRNRHQIKPSSQSPQLSNMNGQLTTSTQPIPQQQNHSAGRDRKSPMVINRNLHHHNETSSPKRMGNQAVNGASLGTSTSSTVWSSQYTPPPFSDINLCPVFSTSSFPKASLHTSKLNIDDVRTSLVATGIIALTRKFLSTPVSIASLLSIIFCS